MQNRTQSHFVQRHIQPLGSFIKNRTNMHEMQNRLYTELCDAIYLSKLRTKMHQNT